MSEIKNKAYEQDALSLRDLTLFGTPFKEGDFKSSPIIRPDIWNNNPRFKVTTNNPAEAERQGRFDKPLSKDPFQIGLKPLVMFMLLSHIKQLAKGELKVNRRVLRTRGYREGKSKANGDKPEVTSTIAYGRNEKGQIYIQFKWYNRDACEVVFKGDYWHELEDIGEMSNGADNQKLADELTYQWADVLYATFKRMIFHKYEQNDYKPKQKGPEPIQQKAETTELPKMDNSHDADIGW